MQVLKSNEYILWLLTAAYATHVLEEFSFDWKSWAEKALRLPVSWAQFYLTNAAVIVLGVCAANVGWKLPEFSLMFPALAIINALVFHILPAILNRRYSPGLCTAIVLFLPIGVWGYWGYYSDNAFTLQSLLVSIAGGIVLMGYPVILSKLSKHQDGEPSEVISGRRTSKKNGTAARKIRK